MYIYILPRRNVYIFFPVIYPGIRVFPKIVVPANHPILIGFSIFFTIHFGVPLFLGNTHIVCSRSRILWIMRQPSLRMWIQQGVPGSRKIFLIPGTPNNPGFLMVVNQLDSMIPNHYIKKMGGNHQISIHFCQWLFRVTRFSFYLFCLKTFLFF